MSKNEQPKGFGKAKKKAESLLNHSGKLKKLISRAQKKAAHSKAQLSKVWKDLHLLIRLIKAWQSGSYSEAPWKTILYAGAAIIYFVNPFDLIPDFIPLKGLIDDVTIITFVIQSIQQDIRKFEDWEKSIGPNE